ncbi:MAG: hypothetical protein SGPRY_009423, partial [Prymnesium sp.]
LALGFRCRVYDYGSRKKRWGGEGQQLFVPSALWWGLEVVSYALTRLWKLQPRKVPWLHGHDGQAFVDAALTRLPKPLIRKLKYYRAFLATSELRIEGVFAPTSIDGRRDVHARLAWRELVFDGQEPQNSTDGLPAASASANRIEPPLPSGMLLFDAGAYSSKKALLADA